MPIHAETGIVVIEDLPSLPFRWPTVEAEDREIPDSQKVARDELRERHWCYG